MQDDTDTQPNSGTTDNSQAVRAQLPTAIGGQKVIQPSPELVQELQAQQQSQPTFVSAESPQPIQPPQPSYNQPSPAADVQMQVGMSASQMGLSESQSSKNWKSFLKPVIIAVIVLVVVGVGFLFFKSQGGYGTKTVQADGFSYTVTFSKFNSNC